MICIGPNLSYPQKLICLAADALEAYDKDVVRKKGKATKESDLNLPEKWPELFNRSEGDPGEEDAEGEVEEDVKVGKEEVKEQKKVDAEEKEKLGCPSCGKLFATPGGLKYHTGEWEVSCMNHLTTQGAVKELPCWSICNSIIGAHKMCILVEFYLCDVALRVCIT